MGPTAITVDGLAQRIDHLEKVVAELSGAAGGTKRSGAWYVAHAGQFANDPIYDKIARQGRAFRRSLRPKGKGRQRG